MYSINIYASREHSIFIKNVTLLECMYPVLLACQVELSQAILVPVAVVFVIRVTSHERRYAFPLFVNHHHHHHHHHHNDNDNDKDNTTNPP